MTTALLWGASAPLAKIISAGGLHQLSAMSYRSAFIVVTLALWLCATKGASAFRPGRRMLAIYAALGFLTIVCMASGFMISCVYLTVPQAVILHYTFPLVTMLGDTFITRERPTKMQVIAGVLIVAGVYFGFDLAGSGLRGLSPMGVISGVISVFGFAGQMLLTRAISRTGRAAPADPLVQLFFVNLFGGAMIVAGKSVTLGWGDLATITPRLFVLLQYPAVFSGLIAFACLFSSLKYISASTSSLICALEIVGALALSPVLLGQLPTVHELVGVVVIMASVACSTLGRVRSPSAGLAADED